MRGVATVLPSLVPRDYLDPDLYAREVASVLAANWLPVCRADQLERSGSRVAVTLAGRPVVAVRDRETVRVLANVCAHRGSMLLDDGCGAGSTLVCPYHRWSYRLDGSLIGAPLHDDPDLDGVGLRTLRHAIWEGFVMVNLSGDAIDPAESLAGLSHELAPWRWSEMVTVASRRFQSTWNWKVMVENWIECYHHLGAHRESVEPFQPARTTRITDSAGAPWAAMIVDTLDGVEGPPEKWMPGIERDRSKDLSVWGAFPLLLGGSVAGYGFWLHVLPIDVGRHDVTWHLVVHPSQRERFEAGEASRLMDIFASVHSEDMVACARVQTGLASGLLEQLRLAPLESTIADFQRWVVAALAR
jgi:phenylpropionate dioxygenase-like ring-hydroxylating dioxygenase large terminal subunit